MVMWKIRITQNKFYTAVSVLKIAEELNRFQLFRVCVERDHKHLEWGIVVSTEA